MKNDNESAAQGIKRMGPEAIEVEQACRHLEAAVKLHRQGCLAGARGCGLERRLVATFDAALHMVHEYTHTAAQLLAEQEGVKVDPYGRETQ